MLNLRNSRDKILGMVCAKAGLTCYRRFQKRVALKLPIELLRKISERTVNIFSGARFVVCAIRIWPKTRFKKLFLRPFQVIAASRATRPEEPG
jgi:hypothetical protein